MASKASEVERVFGDLGAGHNNDNETITAIDPDKPFAYAVPQGTYSFALYDRQGEMVPIVTNVLIF